MKNRDIEKREINKITEECQPREKAFFTIMRQSGLTPHTIKQLQIKHVEKILEPNTPIPCKINIPHEKSLTFIGEEAIKYLKQYLATRANQTLAPENLLFTAKNNPNKEINTKNVSRAFKLAAQKLEKEKKITYKIERGKPSELRLYNLIKFYKKNATHYLKELHNKNAPKNDESYRKLYEDKAMPFLEIETPIEIQQLRKEHKELKERLTKIENIIIPKEVELSPEEIEQFEQDEKRYEQWQKYLKEHPEELKKEQERHKEFERFLQEHEKEINEQLEKDHITIIEMELEELQKTMNEIREIIQKQKTQRKEQTK